MVNILALLHARLPSQLRAALLAAPGRSSQTPVPQPRSTFSGTRANRSDKALIFSPREFWLPTLQKSPEAGYPQRSLRTMAGRACSRT